MGVVSCKGSLGTCAARLLSACSPAPCLFSLRPWRGSRGKLRLGEVECLVQGQAARGRQGWNLSQA